MENFWAERRMASASRRVAWHPGLWQGGCGHSASDDLSYEPTRVTYPTVRPRSKVSKKETKR